MKEHLPDRVLLIALAVAVLAAAGWANGDHLEGYSEIINQFRFSL
jgi:hypothetical protein